MQPLLISALLALGATNPTEDASAAVVLPPVTEAANAPLAMVIQDRASALIAHAGHYNLVHVKQVVSMAQRHGMALGELADPNSARSAAERLGTRRFAYSKLTQAAEGWTLQVTAAEVGSARNQTATQKLPKGAAAAVREASVAIARTLLALDGVQLPSPAPIVQPDSSSDEAMSRYATCYATVIRQPINIEAPTVLREDELKQAKVACLDAVTADHEFSAAWAALSLAQALAGEDEPAVEALSHVKADTGFIPLAWIARFWLVTRYQSSQGGALVLKRSLEQNPGFLLGRGYLAEFYNALGQQAEAANSWRQYLALSPNNPYILTRMAYTLSRLGSTTDAVTISEKAVAFDPKSIELKLELASRYVDAGMVDKALAVLEPLAAKSDATPEVFLRLGFVQLRHADYDKAQGTLEGAFKAASAPGEWRTRARSKYDLALVALKKGNKDRAHALLVEAVAQGLKPRPSTDDEKALVALATPKELVPPSKKVTHEASPFVLESGDIAPDAKRPTAPKGFDTVKATP